MKALLFDEKLHFVADYQAPQPSNEALVRVCLTGICNTDIEITKGYANFRGIPGHEFVGEVINAPDQSLIGKRVVGEINAGCSQCTLCHNNDPRHCLNRTVLGIFNRNGAFAEYLSLPLQNLIVVPDKLSDEEAVFTEPIAAACEVIDYINAGEKVAVIGDGKLGLLIAQALKTIDCDLILMGKHADKLALAQQLAIKTAFSTDSFQPHKFDCVVEASGSASAMTMALDLVRAKGKIILKSTYAGQLALDASRLVVNEITIIGSRCGRFQRAIDLLAEGQFKVKPMIATTYSLEDGLEAFDFAQKPGIIKVLLKP